MREIAIIAHNIKEITNCDVMKYKNRIIPFHDKKSTIISRKQSYIDHYDVELAVCDYLII